MTVYGTHCGIWLNVVFVVADSISANLSAFVSVNFALFFLFAHLWFALFSEFTPLTLVNSEKGYFCLDIIELAQCRLLGQFRL